MSKASDQSHEKVHTALDRERSSHDPTIHPLAFSLLPSLKLTVAKVVLNGSLEVKGFDKRCLMQRARVSHAAHINPFCCHADAQLGVVADTALDNVSNVLEGLRVLLQAIAAQRQVVGQVRLKACWQQKDEEFWINVLPLMARFSSR